MAMSTQNFQDQLDTKLDLLEIAKLYYQGYSKLKGVYNQDTTVTMNIHHYGGFQVVNGKKLTNETTANFPEELSIEINRKKAGFPPLNNGLVNAIERAYKDEKKSKIETIPL